MRDLVCFLHLHNGNITLACGGNQKITSHPSTLVADTWTFFAVTHDGTDFVTGTTLIVDNGSGDASETGTDTSFAIDTQYNTPSLSTKILLGTLKMEQLVKLL